MCAITLHLVTVTQHCFFSDGLGERPAWSFAQVSFLRCPCAGTWSTFVCSSEVLKLVCSGCVRV